MAAPRTPPNGGFAPHREPAEGSLLQDLCAFCAMSLFIAVAAWWLT